MKITRFLLITVIATISAPAIADIDEEVIDEIIVTAEELSSSQSGGGGTGSVIFNMGTISSGTGIYGWVGALIDAGVIREDIDPDPPSEPEIEDALASEVIPEIIAYGQRTQITNLPFTLNFWQNIGTYLQIASPFITESCPYPDETTCFWKRTIVNPDWPIVGDCTSVDFITVPLDGSDILVFYQSEDSLRDTSVGIAGFLGGVAGARLSGGNSTASAAASALAAAIASSLFDPLDLGVGDRLAGSIELCETSNGDVTSTSSLTVVPAPTSGGGEAGKVGF